MALLPQTSATPAAVTVRELIGFGYAHQGLLCLSSSEDKEAVEWAIEATGLVALAGCSVDALSGGEPQRAGSRRARPNATSLLLLDEPTAFLNIRYQLEVLGLVRKLNREHGLTVCMVLRDLNQAAEYSDPPDHGAGGQLIAQGAPGDTITTLYELVEATGLIDELLRVALRGAYPQRLLPVLPVARHLRRARDHGKEAPPVPAADQR